MTTLRARSVTTQKKIEVFFFKVLKLWKKTYEKKIDF